MTYEEWIKSLEFGLKRRYKIDEIIIYEDGMNICFNNYFTFLLNNYTLKCLWKTEDGFKSLCEEIEQEYMSKIMNI